jgi:hypothetical protein
MSVTALADHTTTARRRPGPQPLPQKPDRPTQEPPAPTINVTIELALHGDPSASGFLQAVDALRQSMARFGTSSVTVSQPAERAETHQHHHLRPFTRAVGHPAPVHHSGTDAGGGINTGSCGADGTVLRILPDERSVWCGSTEIQFSRLEFDLLLFFAEHPRQVFTRVQLLESVWGYTQAGRRTVDVHVRRLRMKVGERSPFLTTIRGIGYRLDNDSGVSVVRRPRA